jgi:hypothetical protein
VLPHQRAQNGAIGIRGYRRTTSNEEGTMAITVTFTPAAMSAEQYSEIIRRLESAGAGAPPGRRYHVASRAGASIQVVDVWDSPESFAAFGQTLLPIVQAVGVDPGEPAIAEAHNIVAG